MFDEKRQQVKVGDQIEFSKLPDLKEKLLVDVVELYKEDTFEKLFKKLYADEYDELQNKINDLELEIAILKSKNAEDFIPTVVSDLLKKKEFKRILLNVCVFVNSAVKSSLLLLKSKLMQTSNAPRNVAAASFNLKFEANLIIREISTNEIARGIDGKNTVPNNILNSKDIEKPVFTKNTIKPGNKNKHEEISAVV